MKKQTWDGFSEPRGDYYCSRWARTVHARTESEYKVSNAPSIRICTACGTIYLHVELALAAGVVHVPNLPENFSLLPAHVVDAHDGPRAAGETVGISSVQLVLVIEKYAPAVNTSRRRAAVVGTRRGQVRGITPTNSSSRNVPKRAVLYTDQEMSGCIF